MKMNAEDGYIKELKIFQQRIAQSQLNIVKLENAIDKNTKTLEIEKIGLNELSGIEKYLISIIQQVQKNRADLEGKQKEEEEKVTTE